MSTRLIESALEVKIANLFFQHWQYLPEPKPRYATWFKGSGLQEAIGYIITTSSNLAKKKHPNIAEVFNIAPPPTLNANRSDDIPF